MKLFMCGLTISLGVLASTAAAELTLKVDGEDYPLSSLMANCQEIVDDPAGQIACFSNVSKMLEEQFGEEDASAASVPEALESLRAVAQYEDDDTGLLISGTECNIQILYYDNYFHISRRNVSSIDLFSAEFDASKLQYDQISEVRGAQAPLFQGKMDSGEIARMLGGIALESSQYDFTPKSAGTAIGAYASEVADQLAANESQGFDFVLIHPKRQQSSAEILSAFEAYLGACRG